MTRSSPNESAGALVDTNVILYSIDVNDARKRTVAQSLINTLLADGRLTLTAQVLNEFYWRSTRARGRTVPMLSPEEAAHAVRQWHRAANVLPVPAAATLLALDGVSRHAMQWWDAVLWGTARLSGLQIVYTEDYQHGREVEGVRFINPFLSPSTP